eukprot:scaffold57784_cov24-Tisochrysis_lutea.AAC.1
MRSASDAGSLASAPVARPHGRGGWSERGCTAAVGERRVHAHLGPARTGWRAPGRQSRRPALRPPPTRAPPARPTRWCSQARLARCASPDGGRCQRVSGRRGSTPAARRSGRSNR